LMGFSNYWKKDYKHALESFHQGIHYDSTKYMSYEGILMVFLDESNGSDSITYYTKKMIASDPTNPDVYRELGVIMYKYELDSMDIQMYEHSISIDSLNPQTWVEASKSYQRLKDYKMAESCLRVALDIDTTANNDDIYNTLG